MNKLPIIIKEKALKLRQLGYSIDEISTKLNIAKSTSSVWVRGSMLNEKALERLEGRKLLGYRKASLHWVEKLDKQKSRNLFLAEKVVNNVRKDLYHNKLYCALLYWCEGGKGEAEGLKFSNSDPILVKTFLDLFRESFPIKREKLRALMHLHSYHDERTQKKFWSRVTNIPENHFYKTFLKSNTKIRTKENYPGCITIYYNNRSVAREVRAVYEAFSK